MCIGLLQVVEGNGRAVVLKKAARQGCLPLAAVVTFFGRHLTRAWTVKLPHQIPR